MSRKAWVVCCVFAFGLATAARAQMGMDLFKKPSIAKAFHPVVGKGAQYESRKSGADATAHIMEISIVGKESVDGKDGYWMQFANLDSKGENAVGKSLITVDDLQFHKMIVQPPGQGAMELPANMMARTRQNMNENVSQWHSVGTDTVTVPAGTFSCEHWKNEKSGAEIWTSDQVTPFGMVKEVDEGRTTVLVKVLDSAPDRITGPVKQFDMQQMMMQMQQQRQQPKP